MRVNGLEPLREKICKNLADRYKRDLEKGSQRSFENATNKRRERKKRTKGRVYVYGDFDQI